MGGPTDAMVQRRRSVPDAGLTTDSYAQAFRRAIAATRGSGFLEVQFGPFVKQNGCVSASIMMRNMCFAEALVECGLTTGVIHGLRAQLAMAGLLRSRSYLVGPDCLPDVVANRFVSHLMAIMKMLRTLAAEEASPETRKCQSGFAPASRLHPSSTTTLFSTQTATTERVERHSYHV